MPDVLNVMSSDESAPQWHIARVAPGHERIAAAHAIGRVRLLTATEHLVNRGFGVFVPEREYSDIHHGRKRRFVRPMIPGYVFLFVWDINRQWLRIRDCPGVLGILMCGPQAAVVPEWLIDFLRAEENRERPMVYTVEQIIPRKRKRASRKVSRVVPIYADDIVSDGCYSLKFRDEFANPDPEIRLSAFHKAMGLLPQAA